MKIPKTDSLADKIATYMSKFTGRRYTDIVQAMEGRGYNDDRVRKVLRKMRDDDQIQHVETLYSLTAPLQKHYDSIAPVPRDELQIVPRREPAAPTEGLSPKFQFWNNPRFERRDICFKSIGNPSPYYGNAD